MATRSTTKPENAIALLKADHDTVKKLFKAFARAHKAEEDVEAERVAREICDELTIHMIIEEEVFYPLVRDAINDDDLLDEAEVEHSSAKELVAQIESMSASDEKYAARVTVLGEYISHHIDEEHEEMFPKVRRAKLDLAALADRMLARKADLKAEMGIADEPKDAVARNPAGTRRSRSARKIPARAVHAGRH